MKMLVSAGNKHLFVCIWLFQTINTQHSIKKSKNLKATLAVLHLHIMTI